MLLGRDLLDRIAQLITDQIAGLEKARAVYTLAMGLASGSIKTSDAVN